MVILRKVVRRRCCWQGESAGISCDGSGPKDKKIVSKHGTRSSIYEIQDFTDGGFSLLFYPFSRLFPRVREGARRISLCISAGKQIYIFIGGWGLSNRAWFHHKKQRDGTLEYWKGQNRVRVHRCFIPETDPSRRRGKVYHTSENERIRWETAQQEHNRIYRWRKTTAFGIYNFR